MPKGIPKNLEPIVKVIKDGLNVEFEKDYLVISNNAPLKGMIELDYLQAVTLRNTISAWIESYRSRENMRKHDKG